LLLKTVAPVFASKQGGEEQIHQHHQVTTARVVDRPTSSAPALVDTPSRQPTAVMAIPNITLFTRPDVTSRSSSELNRSADVAPKREIHLRDTKQRPTEDAHSVGPND